MAYSIGRIHRVNGTVLYLLFPSLSAPVGGGLLVSLLPKLRTYRGTMCVRVVTMTLTERGVFNCAGKTHEEFYYTGFSSSSI